MVMDAGFDNGGQNPLGGEPAPQEKAADGGRASCTGQAAGSQPTGHEAAATPDSQQLARDWITMWQSELSAMIADPELLEGWQTMTALWAGMITAMLRAPVWTRASDGYDRRGRRPRTDAAPRPAPAAAASDPRDAAIDRLERHVAALEHRLAELEHAGDAPVPPKRPAKRKPRK